MKVEPKREVFSRPHGKKLSINVGVTCLIFPQIGENGFDQVRLAFSGEHLPDGTEIWTEGGAVIRDIKWNMDHDHLPR